MSGDEHNTKAIEKLQDGITSILVAIGKIEVEMRQVSSLAVKQELLDKALVEVTESVKSLHKRVNAIEAAKKESKDDRKWIIGTLLGAAAFVWKILEAIPKGGTP